MVDPSESFARDRERMVAEQLKGRGIRSRRVLEAMAKVPRELFVGKSARWTAYQDRALPIACEQTISQPFMVALMTESLDIQPADKVLEIGTGSGYQAAVLAELAGRVVTIERHEELSRAAEDRLRGLGYTNVTFKVGDGTRGCAEESPFDRIIITAASRSCPPALLDQLAAGGRLIGPFGGSSMQMLELLTKLAGGVQRVELGGCRFVPLVTSEIDHVNRPEENA